MQDKQTNGFALVLGFGLAFGVPGYSVAAEPESGRVAENLDDDDGLKVFEAAGCEPANVVCLDGDGAGLPRGSKNDRDRLPANLDQGEKLTVKVVGCAARYKEVEFSLSVVSGPKHEQLFRAETSLVRTAKSGEQLADTPPSCTAPTDFTVLSSVALEVPAATSVELRFERKAAEAPPLHAAEHVHVAHVLRPLYFLDVSVAAPFVIGGKRKVSTRVAPDLDASVLTLEEDLRVSPAVMLHVFPGGRRLGAISSFGDDRACAQIDNPGKAVGDLGAARTKRDRAKAARDQAIVARDRANAELEAAKAHVKATKEALTEAKTKLSKAKTKLETAEPTLDKANLTLQAAKTKLGEAKTIKAKESAQLEVGAAQTEFNKLLAEHDIVCEAEKQAAADVTAAEGEVTAANDKVTPLEQPLSAKQATRDKKQKELDAAEADLTKAEAQRCRHLRRARYAANSLGVQLGVGLDLANFGDEFYSGLFFEPVTGLNLGLGMAIIKGDQLNPGYALGQVVDPSQLGAYARESYMIRPYVGISVSFDIIRNIRAATKAPEVTQLLDGGAT